MAHARDDLISPARRADAQPASIRPERVRDITGEISARISAEFPGLSLMAVAHQCGERRAAVAMARQLADRNHPAAAEIDELLQALAHQNIIRFGGIARPPEGECLAHTAQACNVAIIWFNCAHAETDEQARALIWHEVSRALDHYEGIPRTLIHAELRADILAALMMESEGHEGFARTLAGWRAMRLAMEGDEYGRGSWPFPLALEAVEETLAGWREKGLTGHLSLFEKRRKAHDITDGLCSSGAVEAWKLFARAARDMAMRGYEADEIVAAIVNSERAGEVAQHAQLFAGLAGVETGAWTADDVPAFRPLDPPGSNADRHHAMTEKLFFLALEMAEEAGHARPFFDMAIQQNFWLARGRTMGWCADRLQAAGRGFQWAIDSNSGGPGTSPALEAEQRFHFRAQRAPDWARLEEMAARLFAMRREGAEIDLKLAAEVAAQMGNCLVPVALSLRLSDQQFFNALAIWADRQAAQADDGAGSAVADGSGTVAAA